MSLGVPLSEVDEFEAEVCAFAGSGHAPTLSSGSAAIHLALMALGVRPGDEVIVPTLTFGATPSAAASIGAKPVPVFLEVGAQPW